mmetsp:Transcript_32767/g.75419  ORF Transcript_32767/g.75419 Transcript_32767/m.75419 type:complete len:406 (-) Transcript_32767:390-1607(-)
MCNRAMATTTSHLAKSRRSSLYLSAFILVFVCSNVNALARISRPRAKFPKHSPGSVFPLSSGQNAETAVDSRPQLTGLVVIDFENVRGKSGFRLSHENLLFRALSWHSGRKNDDTATYEKDTATALVVDHGSKQCAYVGGSLDQERFTTSGTTGDVGVVFAGVGQKADDVIVSLVRERCPAPPSEENTMHIERNVTIVVTADTELILRCQRARAASERYSNVIYAHPLAFLGELDEHADADVLEILLDSNSSQNDKLSESQLQAAITIRKKILTKEKVVSINRQLQKKQRGKKGGRISRKQGVKLRKQQEKMHKRLEKLSEEEASTVHSLITCDEDESSRSVAGVFDQVVRLTEKSKYGLTARRSGSESTYDRTVLAEALRRRLESSGSVCHDSILPIGWIYGRT